jgi:hypothetical protein
MKDPLDELTPDESLRADNQIKLLKLELEHNVTFDEFGENESPQQIGAILDSILALEEMHKNPQQTTVYDIIGRPPVQPEADLTDAEVSDALDMLMQQMSDHGVALGILAPDDYDDRTIYRFLTDELFPHETTVLGGGWTTNFTYEEFHPNYRYDINECCEGFIRRLTDNSLEYLEYYMEKDFFTWDSDPYKVTLLPKIEGLLRDLIDRWWPYDIRGGSTSAIQVSDDVETAQAALHLTLAVENDPNEKTETGIVWLRQAFGCWSIERLEFGDWKLA